MDSQNVDSQLLILRVAYRVIYTFRRLLVVFEHGGGFLAGNAPPDPGVVKNAQLGLLSG